MKGTKVKPIATASDRGCEADGCLELHYAKGFCKRHWTQTTRHGRLTPERERSGPKTCAAPSCDRRAELQGHCRKHARQLKVHGRLTPEREHLRGVEGCLVKGCAGKHRAKGLCAKHYNVERWRRIKLDKAAKS